MGYFTALDISASGMAAQRMRMQVVARNMAIAGTTRDKETGKTPKPFATVLGTGAPGITGSDSLGVSVKDIVPFADPIRTEHQPNHPDADKEGNIHVPNVNEPTEMVDMMVASRAFEANLAAMDMTRRMILSTIQILA
jgi:flagellar basal-body rod protein FlgC